MCNELCKMYTKQPKSSTVALLGGESGTSSSQKKAVGKAGAIVQSDRSFPPCGFPRKELSVWKQYIVHLAGKLLFELDYLKDVTADAQESSVS